MLKRFFLGLIILGLVLTANGPAFSSVTKTGGVNKKMNETEKTESTKSGLKYVDKVIGAGPQPKTGQTVKVHYTGWLTDGKKFDSSVDRGQPFEFVIGVGQVIKGWDEGVSTMKVGSKRKLIIPSNLGYGKTGAGNSIPPDSILVFDVELLGINQ